MEYRLDKHNLLEVLRLWNKFFNRKVRLIACGGTALTLQDIKSSTKDVDFMIPEESEYRYLIKIIRQLGYEQTTGFGWRKPQEMYIFDLYPGKRIHTTELLESPLKQGNHFWIETLQYISVGVLNHYDLIISKLFRGSTVDFEDCLDLFQTKIGDIDIKKLEDRYKKTASYDISEDRILKHWESFKRLLEKEK
jgi:hypothetical protein